MFMPIFNDQVQELSTGEVRLFDIPETLSEISFRNTDLNKSTTELSGGTKFELLEAQVNLTDGEIEEIADAPIVESTQSFLIKGQSFKLPQEILLIFDDEPRQLII